MVPNWTAGGKGVSKSAFSKKKTAKSRATSGVDEGLLLYSPIRVLAFIHFNPKIIIFGACHVHYNAFLSVNNMPSLITSPRASDDDPAPTNSTSQLSVT